MRTLFLNLIFFLFTLLASEAQPLRDFSAWEVGDSMYVLVQSNTEASIFHKRELFKGAIIEDFGQKEKIGDWYSSETQNSFTYLIQLEKIEKARYHFKLVLNRIQEITKKKYKGIRYHKNNSFYELDSKYSTRNSNSAFYQEVIGTEFRIRIDQDENTFAFEYINEKDPFGMDVRLAWVYNKEKVGAHINSIFFVKNYPTKPYAGEIVSYSAELLDLPQKGHVKISGKLTTPYDHLIKLKGTPVLRNLHLLDQEISVNEAGEFSGEFDLVEARWFFFYHADPKNPSKNLLFFPLFVEPGDEIILDIDTHTSAVNYLGHQQEKYETLHDFSLSYFGEITDDFAFPDIYGKLLKGSDTGKPELVIHESKVDLRKRLDGALGFLDKERKSLGEKAYAVLKTEGIYSYASRLIKGGNPIAKGFDFDTSELKGLSLSNNKSYFLDSLGIKLEAVKSSIFYTHYLF
ncbi:MAG: hypothetical protein AAF696_12185, partial [Bacteroidota bacterium]